MSAIQFVEDDPFSIAEAKQRSDWKEWEKAINEVYDSLKKNNTWTECVLPIGRKAISCKWVFKLKRKADSYLGVHIEQDEKSGTITLSQNCYFEDILRKFGMSNCNAVATPMEKGLNLRKVIHKSCQTSHTESSSAA